MYMVALCLMQCPLGSESEAALVQLRTPFFVGSMAVGPMCLRLPVLAITNCCLSACVVWTFVSLLRPVGSMSLGDLILSEGFCYLMRLLIFQVLQSLQELSARQEVLAKLGKCQQSAVSSLLAMICDAVVETDSDLRLKEHDQSLSTLLMLGAGKSLKGFSLKSFVVCEPDEQDSFQESIDRNTRGHDSLPTPGLFSARMRDSLGNSIPMSVYHVPFASLSGVVHHLIGIREDGDGAHRHGALSQCAAGSERRFPEGVLAEDVVRDLSAASALGTRTSRSGAGRSYVPGGDTLTVDVAVADGLPIRSWSEAFRNAVSTYAEVEEPVFVDVLHRDHEKEALVAWIRQRSEVAHAAPRIETFGQVTMELAAERVLRCITVCFPLRRAARSTRSASASGAPPHSIGPSAPPPADLNRSSCRCLAEHSRRVPFACNRSAIPQSIECQGGA